MISVRHTLLSAASLLALGLPGTPLFAQDAGAASAAGQPSDSATANPPAPGDATTDIVVTGVRASLQSAQTIKRQALTIVDTIAAEDIGKFPDNTVSDALQRVTGVQVTRGAGEAGTVLVRGLPNTATLINGRQSFTGTARGVALQDIPAELIAGVDVYKTSTPDIIEGGVAGVIDIRLHRPFDFKGLTVAGGGRAVYSDQSNKWGYLGDGVVSDRWDTSIGEIGVLVGASYNRRRYQDNTAFNFVSNPATPGGPGIPDTVGGIYGNGDRQRLAYNAAVQWRPSSNLEFHADALYTEYKNTYNNDFFIALPKAGDITSITTYPNAPQLANSTTTTNAYTLSSQQAFKDKTQTFQADFGGKWTSGHVTLSSEVTYDHSKLTGRNVIVDTSFNSPSETIHYDQHGTPVVDITGVDLTDPKNFTLRTLFDNHSEAVSRQWAWRGDLVYDFDGGWLSNFKVGSRYTNRRVSSQATASQGIGITNPVLASDVDGFAQLSPDGLVHGLSGIGQFVDADPAFLLNHTDEIRALFGQPAGDRAYDPSLAFFDTEKTYAVYGQVGYQFNIGSVPVDGVGGVRIVNTVEGLRGNGVSSRENYVNVLPSMNARVHFTDKLQLRLAVGKTITRPDFSALNPLVSYTTTGSTGNQAVFYTGGGGNPALSPIKSTAYDASLEWYLNRTTSLTAAGFYRDLKGYIQTYSAIETYLGQNALVSRPRNTGKGSLKGVELAYQQFFDFLPGPLSGLGAQVNGTFIVGKTQDPINGGMQRLVNVSKYSYNLVAIYEKYGISGRLAYNWRSSFVDSYNAGGVQAGTVVADPTGQLDISGSYALNDKISLTFDATNLTNRVYHDRFKGLNNLSGLTSSTPRDTRTYDRTFEFGGRFKF
jgi:TonB-dependent receptor